MRPYEGRVIGEIIISRIKTEVRVGDGGVRHVNRANDLLEKTRGEVVVRIDVLNGGRWNEGKKSKMHCIFNQRNQQIT